MNEKKQEPKKLKHIPVFETLAISDIEKIEKETNITFPSLQSVEEAKDWVDFGSRL